MRKFEFFNTICAKRTADCDVKRSLWFAAVGAVVEHPLCSAVD